MPMSETELEATQLLLVDVFDRVQKLKELGWQSPHVYDKQHDRLLILESESTGVHEGYCDRKGSYWIVEDGDSAPTHPLLVKPIKQSSPSEANDE